MDLSLSQLFSTYIFSKRVIGVSVVVFTLAMSSCGNHSADMDTGVSDSASVADFDSTMPREPSTAAVSSTDSITPTAKQADKDSIGSKISIRKGKVKVVDTTKKDK